MPDEPLKTFEPNNWYVHPDGFNITRVDDVPDLHEGDEVIFDGRRYRIESIWHCGARAELRLTRSA